MTATRAVAMVLARRGYRALAGVLFALALALYALTLPAAYTGGAIGLISLRYLDATLAAFSIALAALVSLVLTLNVYAVRASIGRRGAGVGLGAVLASLAPSSICCTPLVPSLLALLGASTPQIFGLTGRIQGLFATYEPVFLMAASGLLLVALHLGARPIAGACPIPDRRTRTHEPVDEHARG